MNLSIRPAPSPVSSPPMRERGNSHALVREGRSPLPRGRGGVRGSRFLGSIRDKFVVRSLPLAGDDKAEEDYRPVSIGVAAKGRDERFHDFLMSLVSVIGLTQCVRTVLSSHRLVPT
jgi:hypothetical protein